MNNHNDKMRRHALAMMRNTVLTLPVDWICKWLDVGEEDVVKKLHRLDPIYIKESKEDQDVKSIHFNKKRK